MMGSTIHQAAVRTELQVPSMNCGNCVRRVTEALQAVPDVASVVTSLETRSVMIQWARGAAEDLDGLLHVLKQAGYEAKRVADPDQRARDPSEQRLASWHLNLWIGVMLTVPLMLGEWVFSLGMEPWFRWASLAVAATVQVFAGGQFYRGAWNQLKVGSSSMDTLVALGSTAAFAYSMWALLGGHGGHLYFMEAAAIITLISVGHWIEARAGAQASGALRELLHLAPATARRRNPDGVEMEVPVAHLRVGDTVVLRPGDRVPVDGEVCAGASAVDESTLTGESVPAEKGAGDRLYAGTVNTNGQLVMRVTATGEGTALAHVIAAVQRAQVSRANIQRLADRVSNVFVPVVVLVALGTALWWGLAPELAHRVHVWLGQFLWNAPVAADPLAAAVIGAAAVLIIACPCAMGLATPAAIMASANAAARRGILVRDGVALEKAGRVTAVIFDKTGTLTMGQPEVARIEALRLESLPPPGPARHLPADRGQRMKGEEWGEGTAKASRSAPFTVRLAAALARRSTHPVSQAVAKLTLEDLPLEGWQEVRGAGLQGELRTEEGGGGTARLGSLKWLGECGVDLGPARAFVEEWSAQGATLLGLAIGRSLQGLVAVRDTLKPGAIGVIQQLRHQGLKTYLVTGDNRLTAAGIAGQVGIPAGNVWADVRPEQKAEVVRQLQKQGARVAFVGDGINDAPALEGADLGIAVARASDIAREAADIILLKSEIEAVPESIGLARATLRTIRQNLFWAFFYNAVAVPLAALGFMSPVLCAVAMGASDLVVIGNALRLLRWKVQGRRAAAQAQEKPSAS